MQDQVRRSLDEAASMDKDDAVQLYDRRERKSASERLEGVKLCDAQMDRLIEQFGYLEEIYELEDRVTLWTDLMPEDVAN